MSNDYETGISEYVPKYCSNCGKEISDKFEYCPYCGTQLIEAKCPSCGEPVSKEANFCANCGHELDFPKEEKPKKKEHKTSALDSIGKHIKPEKQFVIKLIRNSIILALSLMICIMTFFGVCKLEFDSNGQEFEVEVTALDCVKVMTSGKYSAEKSNMLWSKFYDSLRHDYNNGTYKFSKETKELYKEATLEDYKGVLSNKNMQGGQRAQIILCGLLGLYLIISGLILFLLALTMLIKDLCEKAHKIKMSGISAQLILYMVFVALANFLYAGQALLSGVAIANMIMCLLAIATICVFAFLLGEKETRKKLISHMASFVCIFITICCIYAPFMNVKVTRAASDMGYARDYNYEINVNMFANLDITKSFENYIEINYNGFKNYNVCYQYADNATRWTVDGYYTDETLKASKPRAEELILTVLMVDDYKGMQGLSATYYLLLVTGVFCALISSIGLKSALGGTKRGLIFLRVVTTIILVAVLVLTIVTTALSASAANYWDIENTKITIGGGAIAMLIMFIGSMIASKAAYSLADKIKYL